MALSLLLLIASVVYGNEEEHLSAEDIAKEIESLATYEAAKIVEYIQHNVNNLKELEKDEAKAKEKSKEDLDKWYEQNMIDYDNAYDKILLGNQVCSWKFPKYEKCPRISEIFKSHGHLGRKGDECIKKGMLVSGYSLG